MSYCRWSTVLPDNYESDLYIYDHYAGYICVNIAASRVEGIEKAPRLARLHSTADTAAFLESYQARSRWRREHEDVLKRVPIDLPYAGESHDFTDPAECVAFLKELRELGYRMPDDVLNENIYKE